MLQKLLQLLDASTPQARQQGRELLRVLQLPARDRRRLARQLANEDRWESAVWCLFPDPAEGDAALRGFLLHCARAAVDAAPLRGTDRAALEASVALAAAGQLSGARTAARAVGRDGAALAVARAAAADLGVGAWTITAVSDDARRAQRIAFCARMALPWLPGQQDRAAWEGLLISLLEEDDADQHAQARELIASFDPQARAAMAEACVADHRWLAATRCVYDQPPAQDDVLSRFARACARWAVQGCPDLAHRDRAALLDALDAGGASGLAEQLRTQSRWDEPSLVLRATLDAAAATGRPPADAAALASGALAGLPGARLRQRSDMLHLLALRQFAPPPTRSTSWSAGSSPSS